MLRKIETRELMTRKEARKKDRNNHIYMEIVETDDLSFDNDLGYVLYILDKEKDKRLVTPDLFDEDKVISSMPGYAYEPGCRFSRIVYYDKD